MNEVNQWHFDARAETQTTKETKICDSHNGQFAAALFLGLFHPRSDALLVYSCTSLVCTSIVKTSDTRKSGLETRAQIKQKLPLV